MPPATRLIVGRYTEAMLGLEVKPTCSLVGAALLALATLIFAGACGGDGEAHPESSGDVILVTQTAAPASSLPRRTATPSPPPTPTPLQVCAPNPDPASPKVLQVQEPQPQQQLKIPFHLRGWGSNIGANNKGVAVGIVDAKQSIVQVLNLPPQPNTYRLPPPDLERGDNSRPFGADIVITDIKEPTPYCLWVYLETTPEGRARSVVQIPVIVVP